MKKFLKSILTLSFLIVISPVLTACSTGNQTSGNGARTKEAKKSPYAGKYLPYGADVGDLHMSYEDLVEADMVDNVWITIDSSGKKGEASMGEETASFTLTDEEIVFEGEDGSFPYEFEDDGTLRMSIGDGEGDLDMLFAREGEAFEKAKASSSATGNELELPPEETTDSANTADSDDLESGTGICDLNTLRDGYNRIHAGDLQANLYKDVVGVFGVGGEELNTSFFQWTDSERYYTWHTEDDKVIVTGVFQTDSEGIWHLQSMSCSGPNELTKDFKS